MNIAKTIIKESFEIVSFAFNKEVSFDAQLSSVEALNDIVKTLKGFKSRDYYYSKDNQRWFDFIVWESIEDAQAASKLIMNNPQALEIFALMDEETMSFSHYKKLGGVTQD